MVRLELRELLDMGNLFHIWGEAGTGKTLLACAMATEAVRGGHVRWICADGKRSFVRTLKTNLRELDGHNITVNVPTGHEEVTETILSIHENIHPKTSMIVIDPITRVLDMSRRKSVMWGRELIEEALPSLVALSHRGVKIVLVSEVRYIEESSVPVMHSSISVWKPVDLHIVRGPSRDSTILERNEQGDDCPLVRMIVDSSGVIRLTSPIEERRQGECSESQSSV